MWLCIIQYQMENSFPISNLLYSYIKHAQAPPFIIHADGISNFIRLIIPN